jgi:hypothetical protein
MRLEVAVLQFAAGEPLAVGISANIYLLDGHL